MSDTVVFWIFVFMLTPGLLGAVLPILPSVPYMFIVALIFGFIDQFTKLSGTELLILGVLAGISLLVDYAAGVLGAKYGGAATKSLGAGILGLIVGLLTFPPFGGVVGLFLGIFLAEYYLHQNKQRAARAASGGLIGSLVGIGINLIIALTFFGLFIFFSLR